jgi:hypothetical protein
MEQYVYNPEKDDRFQMYTEEQMEITLYMTSINMLTDLPKIETPRAKRELINKACHLAIEALDFLKEVEQKDLDYVFSYLFYYAQSKYKKKTKEDLRVFS